MKQPAYKAFISYAHADEKWAAWLHRVLEGFRVPKAVVDEHDLSTNRLLPIFRDRDELASSSDLTATIVEALAGSEHLIVVCSPAAAASRWVSSEIEAFQHLGKADRIHCFLVDAPALSFPSPLIGESEPLAADARSVGDGRHGAMLKIAAGILGVPLDHLRRREQQRRARRLVGITTLATAG